MQKVMPMELSDLNAAWTRFMHRQDLAADLGTVYTLAAARIRNRLKGDVDLDAILEDNPQLFLHAGLIELHGLAQDDEGMARAEQQFHTAARDYAMRSSIDGPAPEGKPWYVVAIEDADAAATEEDA